MSVSDNHNTDPDSKKKGATKDKAAVKAKRTKTKAQADLPAGHPSDAVHPQSSSKEAKRQRAARLDEEEETRVRERQTLLERRAARMVHSDSKMLFSNRTCYNMGNKKHPDSPDHSPVRTRVLRDDFIEMEVTRILRKTRERVTLTKCEDGRQIEIDKTPKFKKVE